jgi:glucose-6-phosphate dehydrogenase assembly protein OpcA
MSTSVISPAQPEQILKGLGKLWTSLGQEEKQQGKPTVLRACAMTLVIATDEPDGGFSASQSISELMREHPSRGIVIAVSDQAEKALEARVLAQCWKPFGKAQQICCEQIEIMARPESWPNVGPTLIGLAVADLPVVFLCKHKGALNPNAGEAQRAGLQAILNLSTKVVVDNFGEDAATSFDLLTRLRSRERAVADLEWTRLTTWREPISQVFDNPARENGFSKFHTVEIGYTDERPSPAALYAAGWLSAPYRANVSFVKVEGYGGGINHITLHSGSERIDFERTGRDCMVLRSTNGRQRSYTYAEPSTYSLMNEELAVLGQDAAFNQAFARAQELLSDLR